MKSLFTSTSEPIMSPATELPAPGPNASEIASVQYDPDNKLLVFSLPNDVQAAFALVEMDSEGSKFQMLLDDSKLGPRINIEVIPRTEMPKFSSPEEADAWLEENA